MSFFSILFALLLEQVRPLAANNPIHAAIQTWVRWVMKNLDTGKIAHGRLACWIAMLAPGVLVLLVYGLLHWQLGWWAAMLWSVAILYLTLGFRQFSHHFTAIRDALEVGDEDQARQLLAQWKRIDASDLPRNEIVRHVIEHSVLCAHRHVFGVLAWYAVGAACGLGPLGAVVYRVAEYVHRYANRTPAPHRVLVSPAVQACATGLWRAMDWLPARATALAFAFVGSFEEAVDGWRRHEQAVPGDSDGVVLAATSGAVNVQLGEPGSGTPGQLPQTVHLRAIVGLVWRTVVLWMVFLALVTLAKVLS